MWPWVTERSSSTGCWEPGDAVRWVQHHLDRMSTVNLPALSWGSLSANHSPHLQLGYIQEMFFHSLERFWFFSAVQGGQEAAILPPPFCTNMNHWGAGSELDKLDKDSPITFFVSSGQKQLQLSRVTFAALFWEPQISARKESRLGARGRVTAPALQALEISASPPAVLALVLQHPFQREHVHTAADWKINVVLLLKFFFCCFPKCLSAIMISEEFFLQIWISL